MTFERVFSYKYLWVEVTENVEKSQRINKPFNRYVKRMITKVITKLSALKYLDAVHDGLQSATAVRLYKLIIRPVIEYKAQCLSYAECDMKLLEPCQNKCLRELLKV